MFEDSETFHFKYAGAYEVQVEEYAVAEVWEERFEGSENGCRDGGGLRSGTQVACAPPVGKYLGGYWLEVGRDTKGITARSLGGYANVVIEPAGGGRQGDIGVPGDWGQCYDGFAERLVVGLFFFIPLDSP